MAQALIGRGALALALLWPAIAAAGPPAAPDESLPLKPEARVHLDAGLQAYHDRQYDLAIEEVQAAHAIDPQPELHYTLGQIERHRGNCGEAVAHYRAYLDATPDPESARAAQSQIDACARESAPPPAPPPVAPPAPPPPRPPWYRDLAGGLLVGLGLAFAGAAIGLLVDAGARADAAQMSYDRFAEARSWVPVETGVGIAAAGLSAALIAGGVVRWIDRRARATVSAQLSPGRLGLTIGVAF